MGRGCPTPVVWSVDAGVAQEPGQEPLLGRTCQSWQAVVELEVPAVVALAVEPVAAAVDCTEAAAAVGIEAEAADIAEAVDCTGAEEPGS